jgi:hypothetical protein
MTQISVDLSARITGDAKLEAAFRNLATRDIPKAVEAGVRYAARSGKVVMATEMRRGGVVVPSARIKDDLFVETRGTTAAIHASSQPVSAQQFKPIQNRKGLTLRFYRGGKRTLIKSGFLQYNRAQRSRGKLAFKPETNRPYSYDRTRNSPRKGMQFVFGLSVASMYLGGKHKDRIQAAVQKRIEERLETGILRALGASSRGYGLKAG